MHSVLAKRIVFWDWNGTILNDSDICVEAMNKLRSRYHYNLIDKATYEATFDFPVEKYYRDIGWDFSKHPFSQVGLEFMRYYEKDIGHASVQRHVHEVISYLKKQQKQQYLISAMEHNLLLQLVRHYGLYNYFDGIQGIEDHYGNGKAHLFQQVIANNQLPPEEIIMIGDTLHDAEIADSLNIDCMLFYSGHQSVERLQQSGHPVFHSYRELLA